MTISALIPARGGSKGVKDKNIRLLNEKPLIAYCIEAAKESSFIDRIIVTTDSSEIAKIAIENGAEVPCLRPKELSQDTSALVDALAHMVNYLEEKENYLPDFYCLLTPSHPFRSKNLVDSMMEETIKNNLDTCILGFPSNHKTWRKIKKPQNNFQHSSNDWYRLDPPEIDLYGNRQNREPVYLENAGTLICRSSILKKSSRCEGKIGLYVCNDDILNVDINSELDILIADEIIKKGLS